MKCLLVHNIQSCLISKHASGGEQGLAVCTTFFIHLHKRYAHPASIIAPPAASSFVCPLEAFKEARNPDDAVRLISRLQAGGQKR